MRKRKIDCIEYLSVDAPLEVVNKLEDKQSRYIREHIKNKEYVVVGTVRRNGMSQAEINRQWDMLAKKVRKKQIEGVVVVSMKNVSSGVADAYKKVGDIIEAGGVVVSVEDGNLFLNLKED